MNDNTIPLILVSILADGKFHSNKKLKEHLGINYTEINKHVRTLQYWGIDVSTILNKGYILPEPIQLLNETFIRNNIVQGSVVVLPIIDSTNQYLLEHLDCLHPGDVCIAEYQYAGRGRYGRKWFSPFGSNLYLSMYWRFEKRFFTVVGLSLAVSIVMTELFYNLGADQIQIKWPNDLYFRNRKLAGILLEVIRKAGDIIQIIIGAGVNLNMKTVLANEIDQDWINLQETGITIDRNMLAVYVIEKLQYSLSFFEKNGLSLFFSRWKRLNTFVNRPEIISY